MKIIVPLAIAVVVAACAAGHPGADLPKTSTVVVDGKTYDIGQLTESTWTAIPRAGSGTVGAAGSAHKGAVLQAIERASGCKVTDSDYSLLGSQLDAQVDCAGRLKN